MRTFRKNYLLRKAVCYYTPTLTAPSRIINVYRTAVSILLMFVIRPIHVCMAARYPGHLVFIYIQIPLLILEVPFRRKFLHTHLTCIHIQTAHLVLLYFESFIHIKFFHLRARFNRIYVLAPHDHWLLICQYRYRTS